MHEFEWRLFIRSIHFGTGFWELNFDDGWCFNFRDFLATTLVGMLFVEVVGENIFPVVLLVAKAAGVGFGLGVSIHMVLPIANWGERFRARRAFVWLVPNMGSVVMLKLRIRWERRVALRFVLFLKETNKAVLQSHEYYFCL